MMTRAFICGCSGLAFTEEERRFLAENAPWGLILFRRNIDNPTQVNDLTSEFRKIVGRADAPVLVDFDFVLLFQAIVKYFPHIEEYNVPFPEI